MERLRHPVVGHLSRSLESGSRIWLLLLLRCLSLTHTSAFLRLGSNILISCYVETFPGYQLGLGEEILLRPVKTQPLCSLYFYWIFHYSKHVVVVATPMTM